MQFLRPAIKIILALITSALIFYVNANGAPIIPNDGIDIKHYNFELTLYDTTDVVAGTATIQIRFKKEMLVFELDLVNKNEKGTGMVTSKVTLNGKSLRFDHQDDKLKITLPTASRAGDLKTIIISYEGIPQDGLIIAKNKFGDRTFFGDNWPDRGHHWLPIIDHPLDKSSVDFIVTAPIHYEVIGNGVKVEETFLNDKQKVTHWREGSDIPTKVMVIGAARFAIHLENEVNGIPVESWVFPQNKSDGFHDYAIAAQILDYMHSHIGPYPFKKLANVQTTITYGGMENASNIFYFENSVNGKADQEVLIAHEIAHQWFGNSASEKDWNHVWLSEGFATYFSRLYTGFARGQTAMDAVMKTSRNKVINFHKTKSLPIVFRELPKNLFELLNTNSYEKGSWVLHMLRNEIGDDKFWMGVQKYYRNYQYSNAQTSDFIEIMEEVSSQDLTTFFEQWLFRVGQPVFEVSYSYDTKAKMLNVTIKQVQGGLPFDVTLGLAIVETNSFQTKIEKVKIDKEINQFSIPLDSKPSRIDLDPNTKLLFDGKVKN